ncbi:energy transducer TonB [Chitinophaga niabensis]|uniref:Protein TonB n=1 Tax=Chitinophaga niabensis TaxID=536979 RepID=A0A1N6KGV3_9BACT|nr:energy transducer TonB [Chitinophaga niabensis]SIO55577.1 protein TonB [Chitinophaga niabensis]
MKYLLLIIFGLGLGTFSSQAQTKNCSSEYDSLLKRKVYTFVDQMPEYPTGEAEMVAFFAKNLRYPDHQESVQGRVSLVFIIMEDGRIKGERIPHKKQNELTPIDKEALKVLRKMPAWKAGTCGGKKVPVKFSLPISCLMPIKEQP